MAPPARERTWHDLPRSIVAEIAASSGRPTLGALDRDATQRADAGVLGDARAHPGSRVLVVYDALFVREGSAGALEWLTVDEAASRHAAPVEDLRFLGRDEAGHALFSLEVAEAPAGATSLREVLGLLDDLEAAAVLEAVALANWHRRHRHCPGCGAATEALDAGHARACSSCGERHFPRTDPAVIMLVSDGDRCVLGRRAGAPAGRWSTLAGYVEAGESAEQAVAREVLEEVGLLVDGLCYRGSQPWPFSSSLMLAYRAHAPYGELTTDHEHLEVRWFAREELRAELASGTMTIPPPIAAGHQLIWAFLEEGAGTAADGGERRPAAAPT